MDNNSKKFIHDNFSSIPLNLNTLAFYQIRKNVYRSFQDNLDHFKGIVVDLGCGLMPYKELISQNANVKKYIGIDLEQPTYYGMVNPDLTWDGKTIPLENNSVDCIIATEVLEHCYEPEILLIEAYRVLKPGGVFFCTVPFIWHLHETPYDEYRYTPFSLRKKIENSGFSSIEIKALGGWDSSLSQMLGLWITYRPMKRLTKSFLLRIIIIIIRKLEKSDIRPTEFNNSDKSMISGLSAICFKL